MTHPANATEDLNPRRRIVAIFDVLGFSHLVATRTVGG